MGHRYPEQLAEWVKQKQSRKRDKNLVSYLAVKTDVQAAMADGFAATKQFGRNGWKRIGFRLATTPFSMTPNASLMMRIEIVFLRRFAY
jgi:hypothetical protein